LTVVERFRFQKSGVFESKKLKTRTKYFIFSVDFIKAFLLQNQTAPNNSTCNLELQI